MEECSYGCGRESVIKFANGKYCCEITTTKCPELRRLDSIKKKGKPQHHIHGAASKGYIWEKIECSKCNRKISKPNFSKHYRICSDSTLSTKKYIICLECQSEFRRYQIQKFCSVKCSNLHWKKHLKELYSSGKIKPYGGGMKRFSFLRSDGLIIKVQGSYELKCCIILDKWKLINKIIDWVYTPEGFQYLDENNIQRTYFPDFKIFAKDKTYFVETKGFETQRDTKKWESLRNQGYELEVWFRAEIEMYMEAG